MVTLTLQRLLRRSHGNGKIALLPVPVPLHHVRPRAKEQHHHHIPPPCAQWVPVILVADTPPLPSQALPPPPCSVSDQTTALTARNLPSCSLNGETPADVWAAALSGDFVYIYSTPETAVNNPQFQVLLRSLHARRQLDLFAIDEAHCVSQWGHDFRPEFQQLHRLRSEIPGVPTLAVTATATPRVRQEVHQSLKVGRAAARAIILSIHCPSLLRSFKTPSSSSAPL